MSEETKHTSAESAQSIPAHPHDDFYLVYHVRGGNGPNYFSCHHCGFIKVPALATHQEEIAEYKEMIKVLVREIEHWMKQGVPVAPETHEALAKASAMIGNEKCINYHKTKQCDCAPSERTQPSAVVEGEK